MIEILTPLAIGLLVPIILLGGRAVAIGVAERRRRPVGVAPRFPRPTRDRGATKTPVAIQVRPEPQAVKVEGGQPAGAFRSWLLARRERARSKPRAVVGIMPLEDHIHMRAGRYPGSTMDGLSTPRPLDRVPPWVGGDAADCPRCAISRSKGANFCNRCGRALAPKPAATPELRRKA